MKSYFAIGLLCVLLTPLLFSCKNKTWNKQAAAANVTNDAVAIAKNDIEATVSAYMSTYYNLDKTIDSLVHLSFLGYGLGKPIKGRPKVIKTTTITQDRAGEYATNAVLTIQGRSIPVEVSMLTVNDTIWQITGTILYDRFSEIVSTYKAKYGYPTYGKIKDEDEYRKDSYTSFHWKFTNQRIEIYRAAENKIDFDARPIREYLAFKEIKIQYYDEAWRTRYYTLMKEQEQYDKEMKPILDSIEAARLKARQDSIERDEKQRRMKDAHQI